MGEAAACLASAALVLGGDTGPLHLARALGRPVVALFHAAEPARTSPSGLPGEADLAIFAGETPCAPCRARHCRRPDRVRICLESFEADAIAARVLALMAQGVGSRS